jgi:glycerol-3-phosphate dehydrogenase
VLRCLYRYAEAFGYGPQRPRDLASVADLVIRCNERNITLALELSADLAMQRLLVGFDAQEEVGPLLLELAKNA